MQQRGAAIIDARGASSAASAANACLAHNRDWELGTGSKWQSMGVHSNGEYGVPNGLYYSFPVTCDNEQYKIVEGLPAFDGFSQEKIKITTDELVKERDEVSKLLPN